MTKKKVLLYTYSKYYYCIACGKLNVTPSKYRSCSACYENYKNKAYTSFCLKCGGKKKNDNYGLCDDCFKIIKHAEICCHIRGKYNV